MSLLDTFAEQVQEETKRKFSQDRGTKEMQYEYGIQFLCLVLAGGVFIEPLAILFILVPISIRFFAYASSRPIFYPTSPVGEETPSIKVTDLDGSTPEEEPGKTPAE